MEENAVARKMILTGGPGSRRFDSKLCANFEVLMRPKGGLGGACVLHGIGRSYCGISF